MPNYTGPKMEEEDMSKTRNLFSESLVPIKENLGKWCLWYYMIWILYAGCCDVIFIFEYFCIYVMFHCLSYRLIEDDKEPLTPEQQELIDWVNSRLSRSNLTLKNLKSDIRSGVKVIKLLEVFLFNSYFISWYHVIKRFWYHIDRS